MEEPGYMLTIAFILGLRWQELELKHLNLQAVKYQASLRLNDSLKINNQTSNRINRSTRS
jgi:hypothetical protein